MLEDRIRKGFGPLIAVMTSDGVESSLAMNNLTFTEMLLPFSTINCNLKDPSGTSITSQLHFDFRDIRRDGFLLSLTVLPSVLHEVISAVASTSDTEFAGVVLRDSLLHWAEPGEHELLRTYLACIFVVSPNDADALVELSKMIQLQHTQQHVDASTTIGPAYCAAPKWTSPNIFKFYLLLDTIRTDSARSEGIFSSMCSTYGAKNCHHLRLDMIENFECTDLWNNILEEKYQGLERGLLLARRNVLSKTGVSSDTDSVKSIDISLQHSIQDNIIGSGDSEVDDLKGNEVRRGGWINAECRESISNFLEILLKNSLLPYYERQMRTSSEQIAARRGISKSFTSGMRKWFGATSQPNLSSNITYSLESTEMQTRRLADLCFMFSLYSYSHQLYQSLRKEFLNDQAWLYLAGALEMAAISFYMSTPQMTAKQYPAHFMDSAIGYYATTCGKPILMVRAALINTYILMSVDLYMEAAAQLLRLTTLENDLFSGIFLERASACYGKSNMKRKMAFHYVLAGHRLSKAGQRELSLKCYQQSLLEYTNKSWNFAEDHIIYTLVNDDIENEKAFAMCSNLIRTNSQQCVERQQTFFKTYLYLLMKYTDSQRLVPEVKIPLINAQGITIIYGERPPYLKDEISCNAGRENDNTWKNLELAAFNTLAQKEDTFKLTPAFSNAFTNNSKIQCAPPMENLRLIVELKNPFDFDLELNDVRLDVICHFSKVHLETIDKVVLKSNNKWKKHEFFLKASEETNEICIRGLLFDLNFGENLIHCRIPFSIQGARLNNTKKQANAEKLYGVDRRLELNITPKIWPKLSFDLPDISQVEVFCGQFYRFECSLSNIGSIAIDSICVACDRSDALSVFGLIMNEGSLSSQWHRIEAISPTNTETVIFKLSTELQVGETRRYKMALRAPSDEVKGYRVSLLFYYRGLTGIFREERYLITIKTRRLLHTSLRLLSDLDGCFLLNVSNKTTMDSALTRVELMRIRPIIEIEGKKSLIGSKEIVDKVVPYASINSPMIRQVKLDCGQSDSVHFFITVANNEPNHAGKNEMLWFSDILDVQDWPVESLYATSRNIHKSMVSNSPSDATKSNIINLTFAVLWRATVINADGLMANVFGENFVPNFYSYGLSSTGNVEYFMEVTPAERNSKDLEFLLSDDQVLVNSNLTIVSPLSCVVSCPHKIIHDFSVNKTCTIHFQIIVTNNSPDRKDCFFTVCSYKLDDDHLMVNSSGGSSILPDASSQSANISHLMISQQFCKSRRSLMRARILYGCNYTFKVPFNVYCATVYSLSNFYGYAKFDGCDSDVPIDIPSVYVIVVDKRV